MSESALGFLAHLRRLSFAQNHFAQAGLLSRRKRRGERPSQAALQSRLTCAVCIFIWGTKVGTRTLKAGSTLRESNWAVLVLSGAGGSVGRGFEVAPHLGRRAGSLARRMVADSRDTQVADSQDRQRVEGRTPTGRRRQVHALADQEASRVAGSQLASAAPWEVAQNVTVAAAAQRWGPVWPTEAEVAHRVVLAARLRPPRQPFDSPR